MKKPKPPHQIFAAIACFFLFLLMAASILYLYLYTGQPHSAAIIAEIYQDGVLIDSINLDQVTETCRFTVTGANGGKNEIAVRHGSIGIISADCPDGLCVRQGFMEDSLLPITCLPNRLVIRLREVSEDIPDAVTY